MKYFLKQIGYFSIYSYLQVNRGVKSFRNYSLNDQKS